MGQFIVEHSLWTHAIAFGTGALGGGWVWKLLEHNRGRDDLNLRRRSEVMKTFPAVSARAYGTREDGTRISSSEQVAAMHVMADMANEYDWLIPAVVVQLDEQLCRQPLSDKSTRTRLVGGCSAQTIPTPKSSALNCGKKPRTAIEWWTQLRQLGRRSLKPSHSRPRLSRRST